MRPAREIHDAIVARAGDAGLAVIVMGVSGSGKSTVAARLAVLIGASFEDGDALHPPANIRKMSAGEPLTDADREPWLEAVRDHAAAHAASDGVHVIACSALKRRYREILNGAGNVVYVFLEGSKALLAGRMHERKGHFMPEGMLDSQFATLESPVGEANVVTVDVAPPPEAIAVVAASALERHVSSPAFDPIVPGSEHRKRTS